MSTQTLTIFIDKLHTKASIGIYPHEKKRKQNINIDLKIKFTPKKLTDINLAHDLTETIDYAIIYQRVLTIAHSKHYDLVENLASDIIKSCLSEETNHKIHIHSAEVSIAKKNILKKAKTVGILMQFKKI